MLPFLRESRLKGDELAALVSKEHCYAAAYHAIAILERVGVISAGKQSAIEPHALARSHVECLAGTANWVAAARAQESRRPDRLFDDPLAGQLAGEGGFGWIAKRAHWVDGLAIRTRFFDDFLRDATRSGAIRQVVSLASGLDIRAWCLDWPEGVRILELDRQVVLAKKLHTADTAGYRGCPHATFISADLTAGWTHLLLDERLGFDPAEPTAWLLEGLLVYLERHHVERLLDDVAELSTTGSRLGIDLVSGSVLDPRRNFLWLKELREQGCPWRFGTDEPAALLECQGWDASVVALEEAERRYGRSSSDSPMQGSYYRFVTAYRKRCDR
ncbi:Protein of unknown function Mtu_121 [Pelodictyon luteolum DSM 273]|uniref:S-adenosyl-L-methionine-dependent methyltransferase n=1 Tax=Chlorobium luteolum (strain DSM 273 / BCRC 81028 / 2530) TaxID=319225 RepID=Q3B4I8_CHLL3|nr:Protein of unknown function Mtu_121 [Pelodictyon luteolum DSM 273]